MSLISVLQSLEGNTLFTLGHYQCDLPLDLVFDLLRLNDTSYLTKLKNNQWSEFWSVEGNTFIENVEAT